MIDPLFMRKEKIAHYCAPGVLYNFQQVIYD